MKKALPNAVLLLLLVLVSGSALILFAGPIAQHSAVSAPSGWEPVIAARDHLNLPGATVRVPESQDNSGFIGLPTNPDRAPEAFPPMYFPKHEGPLKPRQITAKDFYLNCVDVSLTDRLIVKFTEESMIRWNGTAPYSKASANVAPLLNFLAAHPEITMRREMELSEETLDNWERTGEQNIGEDLANLNNFYILDIRSNPAPETLLRSVIKLDIVETAFYQPKGAPACTDIAPTTPSYVANQTYHGPAPTGVNSDYAGTYYGGWGHGHFNAWTVDIEWDWTEDHEDFPSGFAVLDGGDGGGTADHGDACSGIIGACDNTYGMSGESPNVTPKGESVGILNRTWATGITNASSHLFSGESEFIEIHNYGPNPGYSCDNTCGNCGQFGYIAIEYWDDNFAAIQTVTANGRLVYEAAGNGQMDLDAARYSSRFDRTYRDSRAILVGASHSASQDAMCWSNYGSRVDCNGWGQDVYTIGYGDLYNPTGNRNQMYTRSFSGTSSATPIVTAAGNDLQGVLQGKYGITASPTDMRAYLHDNGTPYTGSHEIGTKPNLVNAINWIEPDVLPWTRAGWSSPIVPRNANNATGDACLITTLDGNTNNTYMNVCGYNWAFTPAPDSGTSGVYSESWLDGGAVFWAGWSPRIAPYQDFTFNNYGPLTVRGGRHTWQFLLDPNNAFAEYNEGNNTYTQQNCWSPLNWTAQSYGVRTAPPLKSGGNPTYYNGDGFRSVPSGSTWWLGCAVLPQTGNDVDLYSYADAYTDTTGFDTYQKYSGQGGGVPDMILVNGNVISPMNRLFQAVRYSDASTSDYAVEVEQASTASWYPPYTTSHTLDVNAVFDMYEINLTAGTPYFVGAVDVTGGLDVRLSIYGQGVNYYSIGEYTYTVNSTGANGNEYLTFTPTTTGWYVAVVMKASSASYGVSGSYTFDFFSNPAANLLPGTAHPGWDAAMVARNTNDASQNNTHFPTAITGNATSYLNVAWYNGGYASAPLGYTIVTQLDNVQVGSMSTLAALAPLTMTESMPAAVASVRGGRHTMSFMLDGGNVVPESNETDNNWSGQYVWSPLAMTRGTTLQRLAPPVQGSGAYPNCDGLQIPTAGGYAIGAALLPKGPSADFDMYLYSDYTGTTGGFSSLVTSSAYGSGATDYVIVPWRLTSSQSAWYPGVINWNSATDSVVLQYENTVGRELSTYPWQITNPDTIPVRGAFNMYEVMMIAGTPYRFVCDMLSGSSDVELRLHRDSTAYQSRAIYLASANAAGPGLDETLNFTPTVTDWYVLVVSKVSSSDANQSAIYNLTGSIAAASPRPVSNVVIEPWTTSSSVRLAWNHVTQDSLGNPLTGRRYVVYRSTSLNLIPLPTDSIGGTTDSTFIDVNAVDMKYFYRVKVKAN
ncbi:MAG TPA: hypothetical protein VGL38_13465 [bacterium]|jgi:hypothetical protein